MDCRHILIRKDREDQMVDELTQESFQTGKAVVTVSVELVQAIVDACRKSEQANSAMTCEQKDGLLRKVVDRAVSNYKETHGSLKTFNRDGVDIAHLDVTDERTAEIIADVCKKNHIPVDLKEIPRADGTCSYTAFCQVKDVDQLSAVLKMASEQVLEEQKAITKELVLFNESGEPVMSQSFAREPEIDYDKLQKAADHAVRFEIRDGGGKVLSQDALVSGGDVASKVKEMAAMHNPVKKKTLAQMIRSKKAQIEKKDKNRQRERHRQKSKAQDMQR